jgi:glycogen synthase kinase 3 beta
MIYKAKDNHNGKIVAINNIIKELKHDNCCHLYDYFYTTASDNPDEEYSNLIMEYMPETLYREVRSMHICKTEKNIPLLLIKLYAYQIIYGLGYLHALGICQ